MRVILVERIKKLGNIGDVVEVKDGYARNFLLSQKKAMPVSEDNMKTIEQQREALEEKESQRREDAEALSKSIAGLVITTASMASEEGKLYGSVGVSRVVELLAEKGFVVSAQQIVMPSEAVRQLGEYTVTLMLHGDVSCDIILQVTAEGS